MIKAKIWGTDRNKFWQQKTRINKGVLRVSCIFTDFLRPVTGGEGGIRTLGWVAPSLDFESSTFDHSATSPFSLLTDQAVTSIPGRSAQLYGDEPANAMKTPFKSQFVNRPQLPGY